MRRAVIANESGRRGKCLGNKKPNYFYRILVVRFVFQLLGTWNMNCNTANFLVVKIIDSDYVKNPTIVQLQT